MSKLTVIDGYRSVLGTRDTQIAIGELKNNFQEKLGCALNIKRVSAPLFVDGSTGLNDNLNGVERPVSFDIKETGTTAEVVHSLAKWKRYALYEYGFLPGEGLYTDMNAIRRDEVMDNLHSIYVDQWDWEKVITEKMRTVEYLQHTVEAIVKAICDTQKALKKEFCGLKTTLSENVDFITTQELENLYPELSPKEREEEYVKTHKTLFVTQIGDLLKSGIRHDGRAPDYDDWALNGDILFYNETLKCAFEVSSMGIRVNEKSLTDQLAKAGCESRAELPFHKLLLAGKLPLTMGGGIGQSRLSMLLLEKAHIGEVQVSIWDKTTADGCDAAGIKLL